ncbi:MAG: triose-phosphate isomerase [Candidatus Thermoplasmatota archaeon]|jgi:triosephosphate isomerase|nr:triose-phosphate isomerase [Candidatus Thermoplasmatota archaeon]MCK5300565.1 triose-phosphate isomerase [Thermoplasmatales archaeon]
MLKTPVIVLNMKTYTESTGKNALDIAKMMDKVSIETGINMAVSVQSIDIKECSDNISIPVFAEHIDPIKPGSHTGWILPEAVKSVGAVGSLINHSEHRLNLADIDFCISRAKELDLDQIVCSNNILTSKAIATLSPNFLAVEPPELIGGDISVTTANPDIVSGSVNAVKDIDDDVKVLCGAGVKNGVDVARAIELGSVGVLLASGIIKSKNKEKIIRDLISEL